MRLLVLAAAVLATGCVSVQNRPLTDAAATSLSGADIARTSRERPSFSAMTAGKAAFGMLGAAAMISAGNDVVTNNNIEDPAHKIADALLSAIAEKHGAEVVEQRVETDSGKPADVVRNTPSSTRFVLDVQTINWSFGYFPTDWNSYRVMYSAKAQLLERSTGKVVAEGFCSRVPEATEDAPSHETLLADNAAVLKRELNLAADECIATLKATMLRI